MSHWEKTGGSDEWRTPGYIFDALGEEFDLDVAAPTSGAYFVPAREFIVADSLAERWGGFVWMNPPFGPRNGLEPWLEKFVKHGSGVALVPDRTSAPWFQAAARRCSAILFVSPKVRFLRPDGSEGESPSTGTALLASGERAVAALHRAAPSLGLLVFT